MRVEKRGQRVRIGLAKVLRNVHRFSRIFRFAPTGSRRATGSTPAAARRGVRFNARPCCAERGPARRGVARQPACMIRRRVVDPNSGIRDDLGATATRSAPAAPRSPAADRGQGTPMKKIGLIVVVLAVLALGLPPVFGMLTESSVRERVEAIRSSNYFSADVKSFERGWFASHAVIELGLAPAYLGQLGAVGGAGCPRRAPAARARGGFRAWTGRRARRSALRAGEDRCAARPDGRRHRGAAAAARRALSVRMARPHRILGRAFVRRGRAAVQPTRST